LINQGLPPVTCLRVIHTGVTDPGFKVSETHREKIIVQIKAGGTGEGSAPHKQTDML